MYLLYLDDSGSVPNKNEQYIVLGGFVVFERQIHWISEEIEKIAKDIDPSAYHTIEFHGSRIFAGNEAPWKSMKKEERIKIIEKVLNVLVMSHTSTTAFACVVHKPSFLNRDPLEIAFEDLCDRFDIRLKRHYHENDPQRGMLIVDESSYETSLQSLAKKFRTIGTRWGVTRNIPEAPLFIDSKQAV